MERNYLNNGFWIVLLATVWVALYPYIHESIPFLQDHFQLYSILDGVAPKPQEDNLSFPADIGDVKPEEGVDSLTTVTTFDVDQFSLKNLDQLNQEDPSLKGIPDYDGYIYIQRFIEALKNVGENRAKCRIAYFGDSLIEGDLVTQTLRKKLQQAYSGKGVGFVPVTCQTAHFRQTINHTFSEFWIHHSFIKDNPTTLQYGMNGEFHLASNPDIVADSTFWVRYEGSSITEDTETFHTVKLFYGHPGETTTSLDALKMDVVTVQTDYGIKTFPLAGQNLVNSTIISKVPSKKLHLEFNIRENLPIYGLSFEHDYGIYLDNFACRGNSGLPLIKIDSEVLEQFQRYMDYDLIVLHYGLNAVAPDRTDFNRYKRGMKRVVRHLKKFIPQADILLISVNDKGANIRGKLTTDPSVPILVKAQQQLAAEMELGFLNLYKEMGGKNSMIKWTEKGLGSKDYAHFSRTGAEYVGEIIHSYLMDALSNHNEMIENNALTQN